MDLSGKEDPPIKQGSLSSVSNNRQPNEELTNEKGGKIYGKRNTTDAVATVNKDIGAVGPAASSATMQGEGVPKNTGSGQATSKSKSTVKKQQMKSGYLIRDDKVPLLLTDLLKLFQNKFKVDMEWTKIMIKSELQDSNTFDLISPLLVRNSDDAEDETVFVITRVLCELGFLISSGLLGSHEMVKEVMKNMMETFKTERINKQSLRTFFVDDFLSMVQKYVYPPMHKKIEFCARMSSDAGKCSSFTASCKPVFEMPTKLLVKGSHVPKVLAGLIPDIKKVSGTDAMAYKTLLLLMNILHISARIDPNPDECKVVVQLVEEGESLNALKDKENMDNTTESKQETICGFVDLLEYFPFGPTDNTAISTISQFIYVYMERYIRDPSKIKPIELFYKEDFVASMPLASAHKLVIDKVWPKIVSGEKYTSNLIESVDSKNYFYNSGPMTLSPIVVSLFVNMGTIGKNNEICICSQPKTNQRNIEQSHYDKMLAYFKKHNEFNFSHLPYSVLPYMIVDKEVHSMKPQSPRTEEKIPRKQHNPLTGEEVPKVLVEKDDATITSNQKQQVRTSGGEVQKDLIVDNDVARIASNKKREEILNGNCAAYPVFGNLAILKWFFYVLTDADYEEAYGVANNPKESEESITQKICIQIIDVIGQVYNNLGSKEDVANLLNRLKLVFYHYNHKKVDTNGDGFTKFPLYITNKVVDLDVSLLEESKKASTISYKDASYGQLYHQVRLLIQALIPIRLAIVDGNHRISLLTNILYGIHEEDMAPDFQFVSNINLLTQNSTFRFHYPNCELEKGKCYPESDLSNRSLGRTFKNIVEDYLERLKIKDEEYGQIQLPGEMNRTYFDPIPDSYPESTLQTVKAFDWKLPRAAYLKLDELKSFEKEVNSIKGEKEKVKHLFKTAHARICEKGSDRKFLDFQFNYSHEALQFRQMFNYRLHWLRFLLSNKGSDTSFTETIIDNVEAEITTPNLFSNIEYLNGHVLLSIGKRSWHHFYTTPIDRAPKLVHHYVAFVTDMVFSKWSRYTMESMIKKNFDVSKGCKHFLPKSCDTTNIAIPFVSSNVLSSDIIFIEAVFLEPCRILLQGFKDFLKEANKKNRRMNMSLVIPRFQRVIALEWQRIVHFMGARFLTTRHWSSIENLVSNFYNQKSNRKNPYTIGFVAHLLKSVLFESKIFLLSDDTNTFLKDYCYPTQSKKDLGGPHHTAAKKQVGLLEGNYLKPDFLTFEFNHETIGISQICKAIKKAKRITIYQVFELVFLGKIYKGTDPDDENDLSLLVSDDRYKDKNILLDNQILSENDKFLKLLYSGCTSAGRDNTEEMDEDNQEQTLNVELIQKMLRSNLALLRKPEDKPAIKGINSKQLSNAERSFLLKRTWEMAYGFSYLQHHFQTMHHILKFNIQKDDGIVEDPLLEKIEFTDAQLGKVYSMECFQPMLKNMFHDGLKKTDERVNRSIKDLCKKTTMHDIVFTELNPKQQKNETTDAMMVFLGCKYLKGVEEREARTKEREAATKKMLHSPVPGSPVKEEYKDENKRQFYELSRLNLDGFSSDDYEGQFDDDENIADSKPSAKKKQKTTPNESKHEMEEEKHGDSDGTSPIPSDAGIEGEHGNMATI